MENCSRFVLENCKISNESMAQLREDYRDKTKVVWRVPYGGGSCMTDCEVIRCTYELTDKNAQNLVYCEDVRFMDVGHNDVTFLSDFSFLKGMPKLEAIIISSAYVSDLTPFANCKELKFFEAAFCGNIEDLSPLAQCEKLEMVNISFTKVKDLSPLDNVPIKTLFAQNYSAKRISAEEQKRFRRGSPRLPDPVHRRSALRPGLAVRRARQIPALLRDAPEGLPSGRQHHPQQCRLVFERGRHRPAHGGVLNLNKQSSPGFRGSFPVQSA